MCRQVTLYNHQRTYQQALNPTAYVGDQGARETMRPNSRALKRRWSFPLPQQNLIRKWAEA